jgi:hypothetical protein
MPRMNGMIDYLAFLCSAFLLCIPTLASAQAQASRVEHNTFISPENPKLQIVVDKKLAYLATAPFVIDNIAAGNRFIFVRATPDKRVQQMFIIQQEGFLPSSDDTYKYAITNPVKLGSADYRHSVIIDDNDAAVREGPGKEADITKRLLESRGYKLNAALVMSRFARPADAAHKHEIILFCFEDLTDHGHTLADFPENSDGPEKQAIRKKVDDNCRAAFHIVE